MPEAALEASAGDGGGRSRAEYATLDMTLRRVKLFAIATPILALIMIEIARHLVLGSVSWKQRLILDSVVVTALVAFSLTIFRFIDHIQSRLERQNSELLALHGAGLDVASELALDLVLKKVVDQARLLVGARYGALAVIDAAGRIEAFITSGITPEQRAAIGAPPAGHGVLGVVLNEGQRLRLKDVGAHPRSVGFPQNHPHMKSLLAVPVASKGPFRGNLYLADKEPGGGEFTEDDEQTLERFAVHAVLAIDNAHLHAQVADLAVAQERIRIAHEMHDGLAQVLGYVNTKVQAAEGYLSRGRNEDATGQLHELAVSAREAYTDVRESIIGLRALPGSDRTIQQALTDFISRWEEQSRVSVTFTCDPGLRLRSAIELQLIRIIQESLTNVRKHARASHVDVCVEKKDGVLRATIADDGSGFAPATLSRSEFPRFGLTTMRERAAAIGGRLDIDARKGKGTTVTFELQLNEPGE